MDWPSLIRRYRRREGLKQQALADTLGCDQTAVSQWERGINMPSLAFQRRLLTLLSRGQRELEELRLLTSVERSPGIQVLFDQELSILCASKRYWELYPNIETRSSDVFREFGNEVTKSIAREAMDAAVHAVAIEADLTAQPKGADVGVRLHCLGIPVVLSDGSTALRVEAVRGSDDPAKPPRTRVLRADDLSGEQEREG